MKTNSVVISILVFVLIIIISTHNEQKEFKVLYPVMHEWVSANFIPVNSVCFEDTTFSDLFFLKDVLKDIDIVMLGEQQHGDGTTFMAKSRLIQFLHKEMDFNVIMFEASTADCFYVKQKAQQPDSLNQNIFTECLWRFWSKPEEMQPLLNYLKTGIINNSLKIAGFDIQFSGMISGRKKEFENKLSNRYNIDADHYKEFLGTFDKPNYSWQYTEKQEDSILSEINQLQIIVAQDLKTRQDTIFLRSLSNIYHNYYIKMRLSGSGHEGINYRDSLMAENFIWLKENLYVNNKVIVWAANSHIMYNREHLHVEDNIIPMGQYLKDHYQDKCYTMCFTSSRGTTSNIISYKDNIINQNAISGIETALQSFGYKYGYLDFNGLTNTQLKNTDFFLKCLGHGNLKGKWSLMTDGIFYIDEMTSLTF